MLVPMLELHIPEGINYECTSCGKCCSGWAVPLTSADHERIASVNWAEHRPQYQDKELFAKLKSFEKAGNSTPYTHKIVSETGTCPYLVDNLCFIHSKYGAEFKPAICQLFPYCFTKTPSGIYATVSFVSMGVLFNSGAALADQKTWLETKWQEFQKLFPDYKPNWNQLQLAANQAMTWHEYLSLEAKLLEFLQERSLPLAERLLHGSSYLSAQLAEKDAKSKSPKQVIASVTTKNPANADADKLDDSWKSELNNLDKHLLALLHKIYFPAKPLRQGEGHFSVFALLKQLFFSSPALQFPGKSFTIAELTAFPWPEKDAALEDLLYRYFFCLVFGKKYFGAGFAQLSLITGFHHLVLIHALIRLHAKGLAKSRGAESVDFLDLVATIRQLETQLGEAKLSASAATTFELLLFSPQRAKRLLVKCL